MSRTIVATDVRGTHRRLRVQTSTLFGEDGRERRDSFAMAGGQLIVRVVTWWTLLRALFGQRPKKQVLVLDDARSPKLPLVLMDWESYQRLLLGLNPDRIESVGLIDAKKLAEREHLEAG